MKNTFFYFVVVILCATVSRAQWSPDPFCPYPSDHVTRYPYYGNCSVYWECYEGTKYVMPCPDGLEFNAPLQECDSPEIAKCDPLASTTANPNPPTWSTQSTDSTQGPHPNCPYPSEDLIYFPVIGDCTKYWECYEGNSYLYSCPNGLWWHQELSQCDYPGDFCSNNATTTSSTTSKSTTPPISSTTPISTETTTQGGDIPDCTGTGPDPVFHPYQGNCSKYWECAEGNRYLNDCPTGLWWHQEISQCDYPGSYCSNTPSSTTPSPTSTTPQTTATTQAPDCSGSGPDPEFHPFVGDCTKFWECINGNSYLGQCPKDLWWDQEAKECNLAGENCGSTSTATTTPTTPPETTTVGPPDCSSSGDEDIYIPYPGDCSKYWTCTNGEGFLTQCPDGLWWNPDVQECDYPGSYCTELVFSEF